MNIPPIPSGITDVPVPEITVQCTRDEVYITQCDHTNPSHEDVIMLSTKKVPELIVALQQAIMR